jgi:hypothetical protein
MPESIYEFEGVGTVFGLFYALQSTRRSVPDVCDISYGSVFNVTHYIFLRKNEREVYHILETGFVCIFKEKETL